MGKPALNDAADVAAIARIIEQDISLSASIVRTANSAFYGFRTPAERVRDAVSRLGTKTVSAVLLNAELAQWTSPGMGELVTRLNQRSAMTAERVRVLLGTDPPQASQASLLHDIGLLAMIAIFPEHQVFLGDLVDGEPTNAQDEEALFGSTHPAIGAAMLKMWNSDPIVIEVARHHHQFHEAEGPAREICMALLALSIVEQQEQGKQVPVPDEFEGTLLKRAQDAYDSVVSP